MAYRGDPLNNPTDALRLVTGDIWDDMEYLTDNDYQYYLVRNNGNEKRAGLDAMRAILLKLTRGARERAGDIEVYGSEYFKNYLQALTMILRNPELTYSLAMPYAGGISKSDMLKNDMNPDSPTRQIYIGFGSGRRLYDQQNTSRPQNVGVDDYWDTQYGGLGGGLNSGLYR